MHAYIQFPGLQSKACSNSSPLLVWRCGRDSCLFWLLWFLEAGGVGGFFLISWDDFFRFWRGGWLAGFCWFGFSDFSRGDFVFVCWFVVVFQCITCT